ncbi:SulP family inorganic anion transporter [uncultured Chloroflexus sp.]|uniref:SulP family inorganic anion transporter n=1 Tax=uncultured Chloroflexus sp. TaxID=214040 RepID=UPI00261C52CE|nr:sulfate permease [uncultured Chloroflexus sp.]
MAPVSARQSGVQAALLAALYRYLPFLNWLRRYQREHLPSDVVAGIVTAIMLIPQSMAYAQLAGLPPQIGLYASVAPLIVYALLGTSGQLSVGPVAITSLLVFSGVSPLATPGSERYIQLVLLLAFMVGAIKLALGVLRLGAILNFISHPVLAAFTSASALIIAVGQLKYILGYRIGGEHIYETIAQAIAGLGQTNLVTLAIGLGSIGLLLFFRQGLRPLLRRAGLPPLAVTLIVSGAPLLAVILGIVIAQAFQLDQTAKVAVVGAIPPGLSPLSMPAMTMADAQALLPTALTIVLVSVVESIAVAKALASKRRQAIDPDQELVALGAANITASFFSGYPVTGGFARSVVNAQAGAITGLASLITAAGIALILLFFTPIFYYLPQAVLAATVIVAVIGLVDLREPQRIWRTNRGDAFTWLLTFVAVLVLGIETGIFVGVASALVLYLWRTSRPHIAIVGRLGESEIYRNVERHPVKTWPHVVAVRVDESLYFANTRYLEQTLLRIVAERPEVKHLVLIGSAINFIDSSALHTLDSLIDSLHDAGVEFHLADIKGPVMDRLKQSELLDKIGQDHIHMTTHAAMLALGCRD